MKQILDYLRLEKLGAPVLPPFKEFEGLMAAKVSKRGSEFFVVAKWNPEFLCPDVAFDPSTSFGSVDEFLELYSTDQGESELIIDKSEFIPVEPLSPVELDELVIDTINLADEKFGVNVVIAKDDIEVVIPEEIKEDAVEEDLVPVPDKESDVIFLEREIFPIFEALKGDELSEWLLAHAVSHKPTLSKPEKVKLCEKYVTDLEKSK